MSENMDYGGWDEVGGTFGDLPVGKMRVRFEGVTKAKTGEVFTVHSDGVGAINTRLVRVANPAQTGIYAFRLNYENAWKFLRAAETMGVPKTALAAAMPLVKGADKKTPLDHDRVEAVFALFNGKTACVEVKQNGSYTNAEWIRSFDGPDVIVEKTAEAAPF